MGRIAFVLDNLGSRSGQIGTVVPASTPGSRFAYLFSLVRPGIAFAALDRAAKVAIGTSKQLARGRKAGPLAARAFAPVFGVSTDWILFNRGRAPGKIRPRASAAAAVMRCGRARVRTAGKHAALMPRRA